MAEYTWDATLGRFRDTRGRLISRTAVRTAFEQSLANLSTLTDTLADDLRAGRISLNDWREEMRTIIKQTQMAAQELTKGGRAQMTPSDYGRVGQRVREQYQFLENWVQQIQNGTNPSPGRAIQYLRSARSAFLASEAQEMANRGYLVENIQSPAEHCWQCNLETDKGPVPVGQMSLPGQRVCRHNCKCHLRYSRAA